MSIPPRPGVSRVTGALILSVLPWPAVWFGLYVAHNLVLTFALYHGICLTAAIVGCRLWRDGVRQPHRRELVIPVLAAILVIPIIAVVYQRIGGVFVDPASDIAALASRGFTADWLLALGVYFVVVNAIVEEMFWRGVILNLLKDAPGGVAWTAAAFGAWHWLAVRLLVRPGWAEATVVGIIAAGAFFGHLYRRTGSIISPILWHALVFDLPIIVILGLIVR